MTHWLAQMHENCIWGYLGGGGKGKNNIRGEQGMLGYHPRVLTAEHVHVTMGKPRPIFACEDWISYCSLLGTRQIPPLSPLGNASSC